MQNVEISSVRNGHLVNLFVTTKRKYSETMKAFCSFFVKSVFNIKATKAHLRRLMRDVEKFKKSLINNNAWDRLVSLLSTPYVVPILQVADPNPIVSEVVPPPPPPHQDTSSPPPCQGTSSPPPCQGTSSLPTLQSTSPPPPLQGTSVSSPAGTTTPPRQLGSDCASCSKRRASLSRLSHRNARMRGVVKKAHGHVQKNRQLVQKAFFSQRIMSPKIYFAGSIRGGRQDVNLYYQIIEELKTKYGTVLTEFVGDKNITEKGTPLEAYGTDKDIHDKDVSMLGDCQYVVAEVTQPSLGVGYELGRAVAMGKSILCLYRPDGEKRLSAMIRGAENGTTFVTKDYSDLPEALNILKEYFSTRL